MITTPAEIRRNISAGTASVWQGSTTLPVPLPPSQQRQVLEEAIYAKFIPMPEGISKLKTYSIHDGKVDRMVSAPNRKTAALLLKCTVSGLGSWGAMVVHPLSLAVCLREPGTVFYLNIYERGHSLASYYLTYDEALAASKASRS